MYESRYELFWSDLPTKKEDAATYLELMMWWGLSEREVRRALHELSSYDNGDNYVLIRSGKSKGFYKTDDRAVIEFYKRECLAKGRSTLAPIKKINRVLRADSGQFSMTNNLRVVRELQELEQSDVCAKMQEYDEAFDVPMLSKMENGFCLPTPFQLKHLSEIYDCTPSDLVQADFLY